MNVIIEIQCCECKKRMVEVSLELFEHSQKHNITDFVCETCFAEMKKKYAKPKRPGYPSLQPRRIIRGIRHP